jgi:hypothetical protein
MRRTRNIDYSSLWTSFDLIHEQCCQQEMSQVVNANLFFETLSGSLSLW